LVCPKARGCGKSRCCPEKSEGSALKAALRWLKSRFGVGAPRVAVRMHMPWYMRWVLLLGIGAAIIGASWATYHFGSEFAGFRKSEIEGEMKRLHELTAKQSAELADVRKTLAVSESQRKIESATYGDLAKQVKSLAEENAALKDDLAFFQSLLPVPGKDDAVAINRFKLEPDAMPGEFRYRMLLVQGGQRPGDFQGHIQLVINAQQGAQKVVLMLPSEADAKSQQFQLQFKSFQRVEGTFRVEPGTVVKNIQVRVYQNGARTPKLTQSVNIS
jgi:hypothetical protein